MSLANLYFSRKIIEKIQPMHIWKQNPLSDEHRGKLFYRLIQHAMAIEPVQYNDIIKHVRGLKKQNHNI
jgi:hypothetical protein